jgi:3D (Asp-Asp-Asp) domain-containing protein
MSNVTLLAGILIAAATLFSPLSHGKPVKPHAHAKPVKPHAHAKPSTARRATKRPPAKVARPVAKPAKHRSRVAHLPAKPTKRLVKTARLHSKAKSVALPTHKRTYTVLATSYQAVASQTDSKPFTTADNSHIKPHYGSKKRWMALSRDLLKPWGGPFVYGDKVRVRGISPRFDGVYTVHDTMNRRHHHRMDVLTHTSEKADIRQKDVKIQLVERGKPVAKL